MNSKKNLFETIIVFLIFAVLFSQNAACTDKKKKKKIIGPEDSEISFNQSAQTLGNTRSFSVSISDVDQDNDNDILIANYIGLSRLWLNDGNGAFNQSSQVFNSSEVHGTDIKDLNGDTFPDIIMVNHASPGRVYFNDGAGRFTAGSQNIGAANEGPQSVQLEDIDADGDNDAVIYNLSAANRIWINDGNGNFTMRDIDYGGSDCNGIILADFNGDTFPDMCLSFRSHNEKVWLNDGAGNFSIHSELPGSDYEEMDAGDVNGDGAVDIIAAGGSIRVWLNQNSSATFTAGQVISESAVECRLFDAESDGDLDLITADILNGNKLWINDGSGSFTSEGTVFGTSRVLSIGVGKFNSDNYLDVVLGKLEGTGGNPLYFNDSVAGKE